MFVYVHEIMAKRVPSIFMIVLFLVTLRPVKLFPMVRLVMVVGTRMILLVIITVPIVILIVGLPRLPSLVKSAIHEIVLVGTVVAIVVSLFISSEIMALSLIMGVTRLLFHIILFIFVFDRFLLVFLSLLLVLLFLLFKFGLLRLFLIFLLYNRE